MTRNGERRKGYEALGYFSKRAGSFGGQAYVDARSPGFDSNDLGFMDPHSAIGHLFTTGTQRPGMWLARMQIMYTLAG